MRELLVGSDDDNIEMMAAAIHYEEAYPVMVHMNVDDTERLEDPSVEWRIVEHGHEDEVDGKDEVHTELEEYKLEVGDNVYGGNIVEFLNMVDMHMSDVANNGADGVHRVNVGHNMVVHDYDDIHMNGGPVEANEII